MQLLLDLTYANKSNKIFRYLECIRSCFAELFCADANVNKSFPSVGAQTRHTRHGTDTSFRFRIRKTPCGSRIQISEGYAIFMSMKCRCSVTQVGPRPNHAPGWSLCLSVCLSVGQPCAFVFVCVYVRKVRIPCSSVSLLREVEQVRKSIPCRW